MRKGKRKLNQAGMSLVELVVVILIIGILSATAGVGISFYNRMNATGAAEKLASALERVRLLTISADTDRDVELVLDKEDTEYYAIVKEAGVETDRVRIGTTVLDIKVNDSIVLNDSNSFTFSYDKSNGAFDSACPYYNVIIEGNQTKTVHMVNATGRCYIE